MPPVPLSGSTTAELAGQRMDGWMDGDASSEKLNSLTSYFVSINPSTNQLTNVP